MSLIQPHMLATMQRPEFRAAYVTWTATNGEGGLVKSEEYLVLRSKPGFIGFWHSFPSEKQTRAPRTLETLLKASMFNDSLAKGWVKQDDHRLLIGNFFWHLESAIRNGSLNEAIDGDVGTQSL